MEQIGTLWKRDYIYKEDLNHQKMLVDIHTHQYKSEDFEVIQILNQFYQEESIHPSSSSLFSIGLHPWHIEDVDWIPERLITKLASPNIVAIGEIGIDKLSATPLSKQIAIFKDQAQVANDNSLPIIIHCVKAYSEILAVKKVLNPETPWIMHGFRGKLALAQQLVGAGIHLSFGDSLLDSDSNSAKYLNEIPLASIFLETDDSEVNIDKIYDAASAILSISNEELKYYLYENFKRVFKKHG